MKCLKILNNIYNSDYITMVKRTEEGDIFVYKHDNTYDIIEAGLDEIGISVMDSRFRKIDRILIKEEFLRDVIFNDDDCSIKIAHFANGCKNIEILEYNGEEEYLEHKEEVAGKLLVSALD